MSWQATAFVKTLIVSPTGKKITRSEKLVLFVLADSVDPHTGWAWPSMDRLAEEALYGRRQIIRILAKLERDGFLEVRHSAGKTSNHYRIIGTVTKSHCSKKANSDISEPPTVTFPAPNSDISDTQQCHSYVTQVDKAVERAVVKQEGQNSGETPNASLEMDKHSAARGLGELVGMNHSGWNLHTLVGAIEQGKRRWPELRNEQIAEKIDALWKEYTSQATHVKHSLKNWLDTVGRFIDSDDWRVKKKSEFKPEIDWQGGHVGEDGVYVTKNGSRLPGFRCPPKPRDWEDRQREA